MCAAPTPTKLFHITAIDNLTSIARCGALLSKQRLAAGNVQAANIAYEQIQNRRAAKQVPAGPGGTLHNYVPFHFAPRSPMLMAINGGNVDGCQYRQDDIVHLVSNAQAIRDQGLQFAFSDIHAVLDIASFFDDLNKLDEIDWPLLLEAPTLVGYCKYWQNRYDVARYVRRKETRQAEFLVFGEVPTEFIAEIGVNSAAGEERVRAALNGTGWAPAIRVVPGWYY